MSISTSRPCRERRQPTRNKDKVELNMELIERLENNKGNKGGNISNNSHAKLLVTFVNAINQSCRDNWDDAKEKEIQMRKNIEDQQKVQLGYGNGMVKRSKLNDGKVVQYSTDNLKAQEKRVQKSIDPKNSGGNQKTRASTYPIIKKQPQKSTNIPKEKAKQEAALKNQKISVVKPFKRYSYHVAIAYKIHLQKMKISQTGVSNPCLYDPTYHARKLKQEQSLATQ